MTRTAPRAASLAALVLLVVAALGLLAQPAAAHAVLQETVPADGSTLDEAPDEVVLRFNEPVSAPLGAVRVYDSSGERVDRGDAGTTGEDGSQIRVGLRPDLPDDTYIVTWSAVSTDAHPVRGAFVFTAGPGGAADEAAVAALFAQATDGDVAAGVAAALTRWAVYAGTLLAAGGVAFLLYVERGRVPPGAPGRAQVRVVRGATVLAVVATVAGMAVQGALLTGQGAAAVADPAVWAAVLSSSYGVSATVRIVGLAVLLAWLPSIGRRPGRIACGLAAAVALVSFPLTGHTASTEPRWLVTLADVTHVAAAAAWTGGLVLLLLALRDRRAADDPVGGARTVARFSSLATAAIAGVTVAGTGLAYAQVRAARALFETTYGWTLVVKLVLVAGLLALGAYNHTRLVPAVAGRRSRRVRQPAGAAATAPAPATRSSAAGAREDGEPPVGGQVATLAPEGGGTPAGPPPARAAGSRAAWQRLGRMVRLEVVGVAAVLLVTAVLVNLVPARTEAGVTGAFSQYVPMGDDHQLNITVDPNQAGRNDVHVYLLSATGQPADIDGDLTLAFSQAEQDIAPIERTPTVAGPGHWQHVGNEMSIPGTWTVTVEARVGEFEQVSADVRVPVRP